MKAANANKKQNCRMKMNRHHKLVILLISWSLLPLSCKYFGLNDPYKIEMPENRISPEQAHEEKYENAINESHKFQPLTETKTEDVRFILYNAIKYNIIDPETNVGEGFDYYIMDIGIDNFSKNAFNIREFTNSCKLTNDTPDFAYQNIPNILKMYALQRDSTELDFQAVRNFTYDTIPGRTYCRAKLFAYEVSTDDKSPLYFHYKLNGKEYKYEIR
jgi:hypothetical protein